MNNRQTRVLIIGAAGMIGRELIEMLIKQHPQIIINVYDQNNAANRELFDRYNGQINAFYGDLTDVQSLDEITPLQDVVIHMGHINLPLSEDMNEVKQLNNARGTLNLIKSIERNAPEAFLILCSTVAVYGDRLLNPYISVEDKLNPVKGDSYAESMIEIEKAVQNSSLQWTIFRLAAIVGSTPNHIKPERMFRMPLEQIFEICTPTDTARALLKSIFHKEELNNKVFNLGGGPACTTTYGDFLKKNFEITGLGVVDFPKKAFASKNFYCGFFDDGDELNNILDFRRNTLDDYYIKLKSNTPILQKIATKGVAKIVKSYMLSKSQPYQAWVSGDSDQKKNYFE